MEKAREMRLKQNNTLRRKTAMIGSEGPRNYWDMGRASRLRRERQQSHGEKRRDKFEVQIELSWISRKTRFEESLSTRAQEHQSSNDRSCTIELEFLQPWLPLGTVTTGGWVGACPVRLVLWQE